MPRKQQYPHPHNKNRDPLFRTWCNLFVKTGNYPSQVTKQETYRKNNITVCTEWNDYEIFRDWALSHGYAPSLTIDRIDNKQGYTPANCRFVTRRENNNNRTNTIFIDGIPLSIYAEQHNLKYNTAYIKYKRGQLV